jgi:hypothetical protein
MIKQSIFIVSRLEHKKHFQIIPSASRHDSNITSECFKYNTQIISWHSDRRWSNYSKYFQTIPITFKSHAKLTYGCLKYNPKIILWCLEFYIFTTTLQRRGVGWVCKIMFALTIWQEQLNLSMEKSSSDYLTKHIHLMLL